LESPSSLLSALSFPASHLYRASRQQVEKKVRHKQLFEAAVRKKLSQRAKDAGLGQNRQKEKVGQPCLAFPGKVSHIIFPGFFAPSLRANRVNRREAGKTIQRFPTILLARPTWNIQYIRFITV
jgi:hypothetical protein